MIVTIFCNTRHNPSNTLINDAGNVTHIKSRMNSLLTNVIIMWYEFMFLTLYISSLQEGHTGCFYVGQYILQNLTGLLQTRQWD